jgi:hypothetical protein
MLNDTATGDAKSLAGQSRIAPEETNMIVAQPRAYCYDESAKDNQSRNIRRLYRKAQKALPTFTFKVHFNRGGIAVWGETYAKISQDGKPLVEAYDTSMGLLVRQWDGRNSGRNHYVTTLDQLVALIQQLAAQPFVRF